MTRTKKSIVKVLDKLAAEAVKLRDEFTCQRCGSVASGQGCHWSHIYSRRRYCLRWDLLNAVVLCAGCHRWWHGNPIDAAEWFAKKFPARQMYLNEPLLDDFGFAVPRKNLVRPVKWAELLEIEKSLKAKVELLKTETHF